MLRITRGKGFQIKFGNGWMVSVQFGDNNYCENYDKPMESNTFHHKWESMDAEIAIIQPNGEFYRPEDWTDDVKGYVAANEIVRVLAEIAGK